MSTGDGHSALETIDAHTAAKLLNVNIFTLYRWAREGRIPAIRLGRSVRFRVVTLKEWMKEQEERSKGRSLGEGDRLC